MNVYVRELSSALARAGVGVDVFTRPGRRICPTVVEVEPGLRVHHVAAGPPRPWPKKQLRSLVDEFTEGVGRIPGSLRTRRPVVSTPSTPTTGSRGWPGTSSSTSSTYRWCRPSTPWTG